VHIIILRIPKTRDGDDVPAAVLAAFTDRTDPGDGGMIPPDDLCVLADDGDARSSLPVGTILRLARSLLESSPFSARRCFYRLILIFQVPIWLPILIKSLLRGRSQRTHHHLFPITECDAEKKIFFVPLAERSKKGVTTSRVLAGWLMLLKCMTQKRHKRWRKSEKHVLTSQSETISESGARNHTMKPILGPLALSIALLAKSANAQCGAVGMHWKRASQAHG